MLRNLIAVFFLAASVSVANAEIELPSIFTDSMVIQCDQPVKVWGWATAGSEVTVSLDGNKVSGRAGADGRWTVQLKSVPAGGPYKIVVNGDGSQIDIRDVLAGEVWLCSGQSNMAMTVNRARDYEAEAAAADYPQIRMFKVTSGHAQQPQDRCTGDWSVCSPDTVGGFSATAYFFGRRLHRELNVPIGLINSSVGGTSVESWTSMPAQAEVVEIQPRIDAWNEADAAYDADAAQARYEKALVSWKARANEAKEAGQRPPRKPQLAAKPRMDRNYPANLFNGKINPIVGYTIKGAIWYQGENSSGRGFAHLYGVQLRTLIADWRKRWGQGDFPFGWVQLPNYRAPQVDPVETSGWVLVQEGMLKTLAVPETGMAVTIDVGEEKDIHPKDKQNVGHRLAQWSLADVYGKDIIPLGPIFRSATTSGREVTIEFDHAKGLAAKDGRVVGFAIAGKDQKFVTADARIVGQRVVVSSEEVPNPVSVRYAWAANPVISLYNSAGIPASPFRTDEWPERAN